MQRQQAFMASSEFAKSKKRSGLGEPSSSLSRGGNGESSGAGGRKKKRNKASALKKQTPPVNNAVDPNRAIYVDVIIREAKVCAHSSGRVRVIALHERTDCREMREILLK